MVVRECPKCGMPQDVLQALSREDNTTRICSMCGIREALEPLAISEGEKAKILSFAYDPSIRKRGAEFVNDDVCQKLKRIYPTGCRVELIYLESEPELGVAIMGTVTGVDGLGTIHIQGDDGKGYGVLYGTDICRLVCTRKDVEAAFYRISGKRFPDCHGMEIWFRMQLKDPLPHLEIGEYGEKYAEPGIREGDYSVIGTFGKNMFGMGRTDFTVEYVKDNEGKMLATFAGWD